ncbi:MAG: HNH endonuclease [Dehalococcoidia bacterium]|nr:HNH endonuclease [Dehalococcoidia bacterium]
MRWIDRGPEPDRVEAYAREYTQGWVSYFPDRVGSRPTDSFWREFRSRLGECSYGMCWYCERRCDSAAEVGDRAATLDHFRPLSRFPSLAYDWSNWVFSCRRCNVDNKQDLWPDSGYVDPAAADVLQRPEHYFDYDMRTHEVVPRNDLTGNERQRAFDTIHDLGLNKIDVIFYRGRWIRQLAEDLRSLPAEERLALVESLESYPSEFLGTTRMVLAQLHEAGEIQ